ncbi:MAG: hypothetical protein ABI471_06355 [Sphingomonas bacterium]
MKKTRLAHPALSAFLVRYAKARRISGEAILVGWPDKDNGPKLSTIYRWFQQPTRMARCDAETLLDVLRCREEWVAYCASGEYLRETSNVFNYECQLGSIREWNIEDWKKAAGSTSVLAEKLVKIDYELFQQENQSDWVGSSADWEEMLVAHPETWRVFVHHNGLEWDVIGYWMFVSPTDEWFARACLGEYPEHKITLSTSKRLEDGVINIYGPGMYCRRGLKDHDKQTLASRIILSFLYNMDRLRILGIIFDRICIPVMSRDGQNLAEGRFGLSRMPEAISDRYALQMMWPRTGGEQDRLPALYFGNIDADLLARGGLTTSYI